MNGPSSTAGTQGNLLLSCMPCSIVKYQDHPINTLTMYHKNTEREVQEKLIEDFAHPEGQNLGLNCHNCLRYGSGY